MKRISKIAAAVLSLTTLLGCTACNRKSEDVTIDKSKMQLYVKYYNGGYGDEWLKKLCSECEGMYAGVKFSNGKTGVEIVPEFTRGDINGPEGMKGNRNNVFLLENKDYYTYVSAKSFLDITDVVNDYAVTGLETKETEKTIATKIPEAYDEFLNIEGRYYAVPFFESSMNLNYDVDLFKQKCLYFAAGKTAENFTEEDFKDESKIGDLFVSDPDDDRAFGPDGRENTSDDGLPATYKDFRALTIQMKIAGVTPFVWNTSDVDYLTGLVNDMWANNEGEEQMKLNLTFEGSAATIVDTIADDGTVTLKPATTINADNYKLLQRQKGKLDAIDFAKLLLDDGTGNKNSRNYYSKSFDSGFSHTIAQSYFVNPDANGIGDNPIGFLVDGSWWYNEAKVTGRNFAVLPLPKTDASKIGTPNTKLSDRSSLIFISSETKSEVVPVAKAFVSCLQSAHALRTYTEYTNTLRAMTYTLTNESLAKMSSYGKSVYDARNSGDTVILPWSPLTTLARKNASLLEWRTYGFSTTSMDKNPLVYLKDHIREKNITKKYFEAIWNYRK